VVGVDRKSLPRRPGRVITVSGDLSSAADTVVSVFSRQKFRLTPPRGDALLALSRGRWWLEWVASDYLWPSAFGGRANYVLVYVDVVSQDSTHELTIRVQSAWSARLANRVVLPAIDDVVAAFSAAGVLVSAGPVIATKGRWL
jgi:hypothetical protein